MTKAWRITIIVSLLVSVAACHRSTKAEQLAALESAYQSGIFTKDEYEAKKIAILAPVAAPAVPIPPAAAVAPRTALAPPTLEPPAKMASAPKNPPPGAQPAGVIAGRDSDPGDQKKELAPSAGCEDAESKSRKKGTQERFFPMPVARVKRASLAALKTLDFNIHRDAKNEIEASKKRHIGVLVGAGGEKVILRFEQARQGNQEGTRVIGETKKTFVGRAAQKSWTGAVLAQTGCILQQDASRR